MALKIDWLGALLAFFALAAIPLISGSTYIIGVMTVALCYGIWAASWDFMSGLTGRENFGHSLFIGAGGLYAVKNVSFALQPGSITGVLGPNGAGKTTMFNLLTGFIRTDRGSVLFDGGSLVGLAPHQIVNRGVARTFQLARPFARHERGGECRGYLSGAARAPFRKTARACARRLEIARALATRPRLLLLDEPFAGLGASEVGPLADLIRTLHRSEGLTILIIEHKLREFMQLVHDIIAMDFGEVIAVGAPPQIVQNPRVIEAYLGTAQVDFELRLGA